MVLIDSEESAVSSQADSQVSATSQQSNTQLLQTWTDIDKKEEKDPLFSAEYAPHIYAYMRQREVGCCVFANACQIL